MSPDAHTPTSTGKTDAKQTPQLERMQAPPDLLSGRIALVTGGGWNIGREVALECARAGARVIVTSRNLTNLQETCAIGDADGLEMRAIPADLKDPRSVEDLYDEIESSEGPVDLLACLAGGQGADQPCADTDPAEWLDVVLRNLYATYLCCRRALPRMFSAGRGDILTCAGGGAFFPRVDATVTAYASAKAAICRFTDQLYAENLHRPGFRINCMEPGMTLSPRDLARIEAEEKASGKVHAAREHNHSPKDGAELALFLLSPAAAALNGRILSVDEDWWRDPETVRVVASGDLYRLRRNFL